MAWKPEDVRAFRDRDWSAFERVPVVLDAARSEALAAALYDEVRTAIPGWPTEAERHDDLRAHLRLVAIFDRIHRAERRVGDSR